MRLRYSSTTNRKYKVYRNRIQQKFMTEAPNMVWVSNITHVYVKDVLCSIGVVLDLYARCVVAFDTAEIADIVFVQGMFDSAFEQRGHPEGLIFIPIKVDILLLSFANICGHSKSNIHSPIRERRSTMRLRNRSFPA